MDKKYIKAREVRESYGLCLRRLYRLCDEGKIESVKLGESKSSPRLYSVSDIEAYLRGLNDTV